METRVGLTLPAASASLNGHIRTYPVPATVPAEVIVRLLRAAGVGIVRLELPDLHGIGRSKLIPLDHLAGILVKGTAFYGGALHWDIFNDALPATAYDGPPPILCDYLLIPDLSTLAILDPAQAPRTARLVCDLCDFDGQPIPWSPRAQLRRLVAAYADIGFRPRLGFEYEFFLSTAADRQPLCQDRQFAATQRNLFDPAFTQTLFAALPALGIGLANFHVESGPGQTEVTFDPADGLAAADQAFAFKMAIKEIAARHGYHASFMTKRFIAEESSALHVHQSLVTLADGVNAFADPHGLSDLGRNFLAGQLHHAPALAPLLSPTINCLKAFRPRTLAPASVSWGYDNRRAAIRVPATHGPATRIENRLGGAAADPYIAAVGLLAAGLDGIRRGLQPPSPVAGDAAFDPSLPPLPTTLDAALAALAADEELHPLLGKDFVELFLTVKRHETGLCRAAVPDYDEPSFRDRVDAWELHAYGDLL